jgi:hypothetical protein
VVLYFGCVLDLVNLPRALVIRDFFPRPTTPVSNQSSSPVFYFAAQSVSPSGRSLFAQEHSPVLDASQCRSGLGPIAPSGGSWVDSFAVSGVLVSHVTCFGFP